MTVRVRVRVYLKLLTGIRKYQSSFRICMFLYYAVTRRLYVEVRSEVKWRGEERRRM